MLLCICSDELLREVRLLVGRHPDIMEIETLSHQNEEYSADMEVVTVRPYATPGEAPRTLRALLVRPLFDLPLAQYKDCFFKLLAVPRKFLEIAFSSYGIG